MANGAPSLNTAPQLPVTPGVVSTPGIVNSGASGGPSVKATAPQTDPTNIGAPGGNMTPTKASPGYGVTPPQATTGDGPGNPPLQPGPIAVDPVPPGGIPPDPILKPAPVIGLPGPGTSPPIIRLPVQPQPVSDAPGFTAMPTTMPTTAPVQGVQTPGQTWSPQPNVPFDPGMNPPQQNLPGSTITPKPMNGGSPVFQWGGLKTAPQYNGPPIVRLPGQSVPRPQPGPAPVMPQPVRQPVLQHQYPNAAGQTGQVMSRGIVNSAQ